MNDLQQGILLMLKSAITDESYPLPEGFSLKEALPLIKKHHLITLVYQGGSNCGLDAMPLLPGYCKQMLHSEAQMAAVETLCAAFEETGIDYMPLKGILMKARYPKPELRIMGDADILIRVEQYDAIRAILEAQGYTMEVESDHEYVWRSPELMLELHKRLIPSYNSDYYAYFGDGWRLAKLRRGCRYTMTPEDEFIYLFTHFAKHYRDGGVGCRHVLDLWVYLSSCPGLDEVYIRRELEKLKLLDFHDNIRRLLDVWFGNGAADDKTAMMTDFIWSSGSWGKWESHVLAAELRNRKAAGSAQGGRLRSVCQILFPDVHGMAVRYPVLKKAPWLLPVMWPVRWVDAALFRRNRVKQKRRDLQAATTEKIDGYQRAMNAVGLDFNFEGSIACAEGVVGPMNIVHIAPNAPYNEGWSYQENLLPKYQAKLGHNVTLIVADIHVDRSDTRRDFMSYGFRVIREKVKLFSVPKFRRVLISLDVYNHLCELKPDFVFYHGLVSPTIRQVVAYKKRRNPACVIVQDSHTDYNNSFDPATFKGMILKLIYSTLYRSTDKYISKVYGVTPWRKTYAEKVYGVPASKTDVLIMGADDEEIDFEHREEIRSRIRQRYGIGEHDFLIVTGGKVDEKKKIHLLMDAVNRMTGVKLLVFGSPVADFADEFRSRLSEKVLAVGWIPSKDTYDYFFAADLVFFPGGHSVLWEQACASKVPCVFRKWEGMDHVNNGGNAAFVDPVTTEEIEKMIRRLRFTEEYQKMRDVACSAATDIYLYSGIAKKSLECAQSERFYGENT